MDHASGRDLHLYVDGVAEDFVLPGFPPRYSRTLFGSDHVDHKYSRSSGYRSAAVYVPEYRKAAGHVLSRPVWAILPIGRSPMVFECAVHD